MYSELLDSDVLSDIEKLPRKYKDYALASLARAAARLSLDYRGFIEEVKNPYLKTYVLAELPVYDPSFYYEALRNILSTLNVLRYVEKVYVLSRLSETSHILNLEDYNKFLTAALNYLPPLGYSGKARLSLAFARCNMLDQSLQVIREYNGARKVSILVEIALSRQHDIEFLQRVVREVKRLRNGERKIVLFSRLSKHTYYSLVRAPSPYDIALRLPLGDTLKDAYISLLVARNLGESKLSKYFRGRFEETISRSPPISLLPLEVAELLVEVSFHSRGLKGALDIASASEFYPLLVAHLADYVSLLSVEKTVQ